jgi:hypothetical protein
MNDDLRQRLKVATERLADLEEQFAQGAYQVTAGDAEAIAERSRLADEMEKQKALVRDLEEQNK